MYTYTLAIYMYINFKYFLNLPIQKESEKVSHGNLAVYIYHLDKLGEDLKIRYEDLDNMHVPEWLVTPFGMKIDNKCYESAQEDELIEMHADLKAEALFKSKKNDEY